MKTWRVMFQAIFHFLFVWFVRFVVKNLLSWTNLFRGMTSVSLANFKPAKTLQKTELGQLCQLCFPLQWVCSGGARRLDHTLQDSEIEVGQPFLTWSISIPEPDSTKHGTWPTLPTLFSTSVTSFWWGSKTRPHPTKRTNRVGIMGGWGRFVSRDQSCHWRFLPIPA